MIGRDAAAWGDELEQLRADFQGAGLAEEVQRLHDAVRRQAQELAKRERLLERRERELNLLRERINQHADSHHFVARSPAMQEVLELAGQVAPLDTTVLVFGESGTGKEFVVKMIHDQSRRASGPFVSVNCAALTETLLESELFGHVRGAFTGAMRDKPGLFEVASNGTLFLDELGEVAPSVQAKLLRALARARDSSRRRRAHDQGEHARGRRDEPRPARRSRRGDVPGGSVLPPQRLRHHHSPLARSPRRHSRPGASVRAAGGRSDGQGRADGVGGGDDSAGQLCVAGQRPRIGARD